MLKSYLIRIPKHYTIINAAHINLLIFKIIKNGVLKNISFTIETKIFILKSHYLIMTNKKNNNKYLSLQKRYNYYKNLCKYIQLKDNFIVRLTIKGVGLKLSIIKKLSNFFVKLKLGYSHFVIYKIPLEIEVFAISSTNIIFKSKRVQLLIDLITSLQRIKKTSSYKEKGIYYYNENIKIKINMRN